MSILAEQHINAQEQIRTRTALAAGLIWDRMTAYDRENVPDFLAAILPVIAGGQRQSAAITNAFLARAVGRAPLALNLANVTGAAPRNGTDPAEVYARAFVTVWAALAAKGDFAAAVAAGRARTTSAAAMDVQLTMRSTLRDIGDRDQRILGYRRVPDGGACDFCKLVAGQRYRTDELMPVHNHCGCGVDVITSANRAKFTGKTENDLAIDPKVQVAVEEHGELGPLLVNAQDNFTAL